MSEFMFGVSTVKLTAAERRKAVRAAKAEEAELVEVSGPQFGGYRRWFTARNMGHPFDEARARAVYARLAKP